MRKNCIRVVVCLLGVSLFLLPTVYSGFCQEEEVSRLKDSGFGDDLTRPAAVFDHDAHNEKAKLEEQCYYCHHVDGANPSPDDTSEGQECSECHSLAPDDGTTSLERAYHGQCKTCHEKQRKGPVACGQCHVM